MTAEHFQFEMMGVLFPLTPALSLREREKRSLLSGAATAECCTMTNEFYELIQRLFLLPWGEGKDEGETRCQSGWQPANKTDS